MGVGGLDSGPRLTGTGLWFTRERWEAWKKVLFLECSILQPIT